MDEQGNFLKEASTSVKKNAYFMQKAMVGAHMAAWQARGAAVNAQITVFLPAPQDEDNLREALRYSAAMLGELRTSYLSPQKYYELYMQVFDQLAHLEVRAARGPGAAPRKVPGRAPARPSACSSAARESAPQQ